MLPHPVLRAVLTLIVAAGFAGGAAGQHSCDDPPALTVLTGSPVVVSALSTEGHPTGFEWYVTPPGGTTPTKPDSQLAVVPLNLDHPGLWSIALVANYAHQAVPGVLWTSEDCVTIEATSVVASIGLSSVVISTDDSLVLDGIGSEWAVGVIPVVVWHVDDLPFTACNGGPPPSSPDDLGCTIPAGWLDPGWHTAALELTDQTSGQSSLASADFEVIEVVPLSVDLSWSPLEPDPNQLVIFNATVTPTIPEEDFVQVIWDLGDGTVVTYNSCPTFYGSCLRWPHSYATDGWYDVSFTLQTAGEVDTVSYRVKVGDPIEPPLASFSPSTANPFLLASTSFSFTGSCEGTCIWHWDFGDGTQSTAPSPSHSWQLPGPYTVGLTVSNQSGNDSAFAQIDVRNCWSPTSPTQSGSCYGEPVNLTAAAGSAWSWSTGAGSQAITISQAGGYWVNVRTGSACWGHAPKTVLLVNCGDPGGDANLDGSLDAADPSALITELTDGDGDAVVGAGGGDLMAPGGDVTGDGRIRVNDLLTVLLRLFE